jgi:hypothetical protein
VIDYLARLKGRFAVKLTGGFRLARRRASCTTTRSLVSAAKLLVRITAFDLAMWTRPE